MQDKGRKITYGAMMTAMFAVMLAVSFYIPPLGVLLIFFIPLPIILYRLSFDRISTLLVMTIGVNVSLLIGGLGLVPFALAFGVLGLVIGDTMRQEKTKLYTFMASGLTFLIIIILTYVGSVLLLGINVIEVLMISLREAQVQMTSIMVKFGESPENFNKQMEAMMTLYETSIPSTFIIGAFSFSFVIVLLNSMIVNRLGHNVPKFLPFREMKLPSIAVWLFLLILILPYIANIEQGTMLNLTYVNAAIIFRVLFVIQGISFIHYYLSEMKLPTWVTVISTILALMFSPATVLLGVLDSGMNIRAWLGKGKGN